MSRLYCSFNNKTFSSVIDSKSKLVTLKNAISNNKIVLCLWAKFINSSVVEINKKVVKLRITISKSVIYGGMIIVK